MKKNNTVDVNIPFHAEMAGTLTYNETDHPDRLQFTMEKDF
jgi:hypothetical protein